jgi:aminomethyltransferase
MVQSAEAQELRHTPIHDRHVALGGKMVPFAGYEMPVQYPTGITAEHHAVRERAGLFDVSHMGEVEVRGPGAVEFVNFITTNDVNALEVGQAQYTMMLNDRGTILDDFLVYRMADRYMMVVNASNRERDVAHMMSHLDRFDCTLEDVSDSVALLALQGPRAADVLATITDKDLAAISYYHFAEGEVAGVPAIISRTGYTGEDGFELYVAADKGGQLWDVLLATGEVTPAGLGARDSLRLEAGMVLYGNDIDESVTPYEGNLGWTVKLKKGDFVGRDALLKQKEAGVPRKLVGFTTEERTFPRPGYRVYQNGEASGAVRSGTMSPTLGIPIGTCYLPAAGAVEGAAMEVEIRGKRIPARVVRLPFYKRSGRS